MNTYVATADNFSADRNPMLTEFPTFGEPDLGDDYVLIIDSSTLYRECLSRSLSAYTSNMSVESIEEWQSTGLHNDPSAVLLVLGNARVSDDTVLDNVTQVVERFRPNPVVVISASDDLGEILKIIECGARGYIPHTLNIRMAAEAIALTRAGGIFIPAGSVLAKKEALGTNAANSSQAIGLFTPREVKIAEALRRGKANKIIAYEMNLCESTVKVHIRNIMKKLNARNRTEVAFKLT